MKKLDNKGFAISTILYGLLVVMILLTSLLMGTMSFSRKNSKNFIDSVKLVLESLVEVKLIDNVTKEITNGTCYLGETCEIKVKIKTGKGVIYASPDAYLPPYFYSDNSSEKILPISSEKSIDGGSPVYIFKYKIDNINVNSLNYMIDSKTFFYDGSTNIKVDYKSFINIKESIYQVRSNGISISDGGALTKISIIMDKTGKQMSKYDIQYKIFSNVYMGVKDFQSEFYSIDNFNVLNKSDCYEYKFDIKIKNKYSGPYNEYYFGPGQYEKDDCYYPYIKFFDKNPIIDLNIKICKTDNKFKIK